MTTPIRTALAIVQTALSDALTPVAPVFGAIPAIYWRQAPTGVAGALLSGALTGCMVIQAQDGGGQATYTLGAEGWTGLITIRCMAATPAAALALLASIPDPVLLSADGYDVRATWQRPLDLPDADGISTAAGIYRISIDHA